MPRLKNVLIASVILYGSVFALYGDYELAQWGIHQTIYEDEPISRGTSVGYSATEGTYVTTTPSEAPKMVEFHKKGMTRPGFVGGRGAPGQI